MSSPTKKKKQSKKRKRRRGDPMSHRMIRYMVVERGVVQAVDVSTGIEGVGTSKTQTGNWMTRARLTAKSHLRKQLIERKVL